MKRGVSQHPRTESDLTLWSSVWFRISSTGWRWSCCKRFRICLKGIYIFKSFFFFFKKQTGKSHATHAPESWRRPAVLQRRERGCCADTHVCSSSSERGVCVCVCVCACVSTCLHMHIRGRERCLLNRGDSELGAHHSQWCTWKAPEAWLGTPSVHPVTPWWLLPAALQVFPRGLRSHSRDQQVLS